jgi:hypothetical protein
MKKVLFEISGEERNRILEMHQTATSKQYLMEDVGDDEKILALEILILLDTITKREDFDFAKLQGENREMYVDLSDLQSEIAMKLLPIYSLPKTSNEQSWRTLMKVISHRKDLTPNKESEELFEFLDKLIETIQKYFPNETMQDLEQKMLTFNETLNNLK